MFKLTVIEFNKNGEIHETSRYYAKNLKQIEKKLEDEIDALENLFVDGVDFSEKFYFFRVENLNTGEITNQSSSHFI